MKKYGKIAALIAGVVLALGFASCKADTDDDDTSQPPAYYTVTFNSNGGTEVTSQSIESGNKATKPAAPTKQATETETYTFDNWYTSTDGRETLSDTAFDFDTAIEGDITLYAKWNVYTIEYIELKDCSEIRTMFETLCEYSNSERKFKKLLPALQRQMQGLKLQKTILMRQEIKFLCGMIKEKQLSIITLSPTEK